MSDRRRPGPSLRYRVGVGAVDVALIVAVLSWGLHTHAMEPAEAPMYAARTIVPFLAGWAVWAPVIGAYRGPSMASFRHGPGRTLLAWLAAAVTGAGIRATPLVPGDAPWIFVAVVFGVGAVVLLPWRLVVALSARA